MRSSSENSTRTLLDGCSRTALDQVRETLKQALRVLEMVPMVASELTPHPVTVVRSEIRNAQRYLELLGIAADLAPAAYKGGGFARVVNAEDREPLAGTLH